jgi:hypothetical protein
MSLCVAQLFFSSLARLPGLHELGAENRDVFDDPTLINKGDYFV